MGPDSLSVQFNFPTCPTSNRSPNVGPQRGLKTTLRHSQSSSVPRLSTPTTPFKSSRPIYDTTTRSGALPTQTSRSFLDPSTPIWWASDIDGHGKNASCSFRTINYGTFTGDLPARKASGKSFQFSAMLHLTIEDGLIVSMDESYRDTFDESVPLERFRKRDS